MVSCMPYLDFQAKWPRDDYIHGMVHGNIPHIWTEAYFGMTNNIDKQGIQLFGRKKWISIFFV
jgi:hypothetical protein